MIMAIKMMKYLEEQPVVWDSILRERGKLFKDLLSGLKDYKPKRILLVGSGSSCNAALLAAQFYEEVLGLEAQAVVPTRLGALPDLLPPDGTLVFAVSQSGRSTSTMRIIERLRKANFTVVAFTADASSFVANACDLHQLIDCGEEDVGPKTKGMTATVLTLYLAGIALCVAQGRFLPEKAESLYQIFARSFAAAPENIRKCRAFCETNLKVLAEQPHFTLISDTIGYPIACEGALKVLETLYVPAAAYEFEEYLHGVNNLIQPGECNLLMPVDPKNFARMHLLDDYCKAHGCIDFIVTSDAEAGFENGLLLEGGESVYTQPFESLLLLQVLSALGSEFKKIDCDKPKFRDFYAVMETKA
jgi:glucoselysine-6-phosphate deglycase